MSGATVAVMIRRARQDIVRHFTDAGATSPQKAVAYDPDVAGRRLRRMRRKQFARLQEFGAVREPKPGLFYLDQDRLDAFVWTMRKRALGLIGLAGAAAAVAVAFAG